MKDSSNDSKNIFEDSVNQDLIRRIEILERSFRNIAKGGMLSSKDFLDLCIKEDEEEAFLKAHKNRKWDDESIYKEVPIDTTEMTPPETRTLSLRRPRFLIKPFNPLNVTPFSYDLSVGTQAYSLRLTTRRRFPLGSYEIEPGETIIVLTEEDIALPPHYSATVWPRFDFVSEGIFQSMVKIDPTWRGHLAVALTNVSPAKYPIERGRLFGTLIVYELTQRSQYSLRRTQDLDLIIVRLPNGWMQANGDKCRLEIENHGLSDLCEIIEDKEGHGCLKIKKEKRKTSEFEKLKRVYDDNAWRKAVKDAIKEVIQSDQKGMNAYELDDLDRIIESVPKGRRLKREDLKEECSQEDLQKIALEYGGPFSCIFSIPGFVLNRVKSEVKPTIQTEISAALYPKFVTLTLTVFGLLSLIAAIVSLILSKFPLPSPLIGFEWRDTISIAAVVLGAVLIYLIWKGFVSDKRLSTQLEKEVAQLKAIHEHELTTIIGSIFPKWLMLSLTIVGLLSLAGAITILILIKFQGQSALSRIDLMSIIECAIFIGILNFLALFFLLWKGFLLLVRRLNALEKKVSGNVEKAM